MTAEIHASRGAGHPFTGKPGWDHLHIKAGTYAELDICIQAAEKKFWQVWIRADNMVVAVLYKPSGTMAPWVDSPR